jgi:hypothetical protein
MAPGQIVGLWGARGGVVCCIQAVVRVRARGWTQEGVATGFSVCPLGAGRCWSRSERDVNFQFSRSERRVFSAPFNTPRLHLDSAFNSTLLVYHYKKRDLLPAFGTCRVL